MGIARGWEKRVIRTNITYAKRTVRIFSVSPQSRSLFSASFHTFCLTARAYLNTQNTDCFRIFSVSSQSRSLFSASFHTCCLTARAYLNTQNTDCFAVYILHSRRYELRGREHVSDHAALPSNWIGGGKNDFRGPLRHALRLPSRVSLARARFFLRLLVPSASYAG